MSKDFSFLPKSAVNLPGKRKTEFGFNQTQLDLNQRRNEKFGASEGSFEAKKGVLLLKKLLKEMLVTLCVSASWGGGGGVNKSLGAGRPSVHLRRSECNRGKNRDSFAFMFYFVCKGTEIFE
jgi:hypothetical protein